jgi:hypothetical protein
MPKDWKCRQRLVPLGTKRCSQRHVQCYPKSTEFEAFQIIFVHCRRPGGVCRRHGKRQVRTIALAESISPRVSSIRGYIASKHWQSLSGLVPHQDALTLHHLCACSHSVQCMLCSEHQLNISLTCTQYDLTALRTVGASFPKIVVAALSTGCAKTAKRASGPTRLLATLVQ